MGIPSFYKWLSDRYPLCIAEAVDEAPVSDDGKPLPVDASLPNPNGFEFDNLYLDMNGIIHPCFHPERMVNPTTYEEVFEAMYKYIDRVLAVVRPRKLLFLAIDGVAPRAKMNQQRSRRFKAAKEAADSAPDLVNSSSSESEEDEESLLLPGSCGEQSPKSKETEEDSAKEASPALQTSMQMDSNVITPGTEFMQELSSALRYYINMRMDENLAWRGLKVIVSDASVPGEGEHKIMSFIRLQRNLPGYDPYTRHCLFGLDADLIMLALVSHEVHFSILRGEVRMRKKQRKMANRKFRSLSIEEKVDKAAVAAALADYIRRLEFKFINIWVLREYLALDMKPSVKVDMERLIDDFVLMCIFVGNDFLPNLPGLEISEGAINLLLLIYKKEFVGRGGYLTDSYKVNLERLEHLLQSVGTHEYKILKKRKTCKAKLKKFKSRANISCKIHNQSEFNNSSSKSTPPPVSQDLDSDLSEECLKERFYFVKFGVQSEKDLMQFKKTAVCRYVEGVSWVMRYYYDGICSWHWFYPYHYAPFASDFHPIDQLKIHFTLGQPFKPLDQLMAVLPAASAHALPPLYRELMTDATSPIIDFYPTEFELDMDGKRFEWQAIIKLPFIDESRLLAEIAKVEHTLTDDERRRNSMGLDLLFVHSLHPLSGWILSTQEKMNNNLNLTQSKVEHNLNPSLSDGMNGFIYLPAESVPVNALPTEDMKTKERSGVICVSYKCPSSHQHIPRPPKHVTLPKRCIKPLDIMPLERLWRTSKGRGRARAARLLKFESKLPGTDLSVKKKKNKSDYLENQRGLKDRAHKKDRCDHVAGTYKLARTGTSDKMESTVGANRYVMKLRSYRNRGASTIGTNRNQDGVHNTFMKPAESSLIPLPKSDDSSVVPEKPKDSSKSGGFHLKDNTFVRPAESSLSKSDQSPAVGEKPKDSSTSGSLHLHGSAVLNNQTPEERLESIRKHVAAKGWLLVVPDKSKKNKRNKNRKRQKVSLSASFDKSGRQEQQEPGEGSGHPESQKDGGGLMKLSGELQGKLIEAESKNPPAKEQGSSLTTQDAKKTDLQGKKDDNQKTEVVGSLNDSGVHIIRPDNLKGTPGNSLPESKVDVRSKKRKRKAKKTVSSTNSSVGPNEIAAKVVLEGHKEEKVVSGPDSAVVLVESKKRKRKPKKKKRSQGDIGASNGANSSFGPNETAAKVILEEHKEEKGNHAVVSGPNGAVAQVESKKRKRKSKKMKRSQKDIGASNGANIVGE